MTATAERTAPAGRGGSPLTTAFLGSLSAVAGRSFATTEETLDAMLRVIGRQLGMRTSYLAWIDRGAGRSEIVAVYAESGGCAVGCGRVYALADTYCGEIATAAEPGPLLIRNAVTDPRFAGHRARSVFPDVASYIAVPIVLAGGDFYGTLCAVDPEPRSLAQDQAELMTVLARFVATLCERDRAEQALRRTEERFRTLADASPVGIFLTDDAGHAEYTNRSWQDLTGLTAAESDGEGWARAIHPDDRPAVFAAWADAVHAGRPFAKECRFRRPDGTERWGNMRASVLHGADGAPAGYVGTVADVTERKHAEEEMAAALRAQWEANEQLRRLNRAKSDFVSVVSHEFRTPLTGILGFAELIREEELNRDEVLEYAGEIRASARRLNRLIADLLDLDKMQSGRMTMRQDPVDLNVVVAEVVAALRVAASRHTIRTELDPRLPPLFGDRDRLVQVVTNLVGNAVKYSPNGGEVVVTSAFERDRARVAVRDAGIGIPPEALETIFERYTRVESAEGRTIEGTGLGLPIAREIVELHGGRIWAESVPGNGATVQFVLPFTRPEAGS
jgi:PAS domain S-box-containing protein